MNTQFVVCLIWGMVCSNKSKLLIHMTTWINLKGIIITEEAQYEGLPIECSHLYNILEEAECRGRKHKVKWLESRWSKNWLKGGKANFTCWWKWYVDHCSYYTTLYICQNHPTVYVKRKNFILWKLYLLTPHKTTNKP